MNMSWYENTRKALFGNKPNSADLESTNKALEVLGLRTKKADSSITHIDYQQRWNDMFPVRD